MQKPAEPNAFAGALFADAIHAVVPVASPHQGKPVDAERKAGVKGERAMFKQCHPPLGNDRRKETVVFAGIQRLTLEEGIVSSRTAMSAVAST